MVIWWQSWSWNFDFWNWNGDGMEEKYLLKEVGKKCFIKRLIKGYMKIKGVKNSEKNFEK